MASHSSGLLAALAWTLLPGTCLLCGLPSGRRRDLCRTCEAALTPLRPACSRCALPLSSDGALCAGCRRRSPPFDRLQAACVYVDPADVLVQMLKFHRRTAAARVMAAVMAERLGTASDEGHAVLVPVPLHPWRRWRRGFDQAELIARHLGRAIGTPVDTAWLRRCRATAPQSGLSQAARRRNVADAFVLRPRPRDRIPPRVILVDDVATTTATVAVLARALRREGVGRVDVWTFARTPAERATSH